MLPCYSVLRIQEGHVGNHKKRYLAKQLQQLQNRQENALYYQNGKDQAHPRSDRERDEHRKLK